jgi:hypothetical protein
MVNRVVNKLLKCCSCGVGTSCQEPLTYDYLAYEHIERYSPVFCVKYGNSYKVYVSQQNQFDGGRPWLVGIAQNSAQIGENVEVLFTGYSKVRFYDRAVGNNDILYLLDWNIKPELLGASCTDHEPEAKVYTSQGKRFQIGKILPNIRPMIGMTQHPFMKLAEVFLDIRLV